MYKVMWQIYNDKPRAILTYDNEKEARAKAEEFNSALDDESEQFYYVESEL